MSPFSYDSKRGLIQSKFPMLAVGKMHAEFPAHFISSRCVPARIFWARFSTQAAFRNLVRRDGVRKTPRPCDYPYNFRLQFAIVEKRRGRQCPRVAEALPKRYTVKYLKKEP
jgi:hypothetical protein